MQILLLKIKNTTLVTRKKIAIIKPDIQIVKTRRNPAGCPERGGDGALRMIRATK